MKKFQICNFRKQKQQVNNNRTSTKDSNFYKQSHKAKNNAQTLENTPKKQNKPLHTTYHKPSTDM